MLTIQFLFLLSFFVLFFLRQTNGKTNIPAPAIPYFLPNKNFSQKYCSQLYSKHDDKYPFEELPLTLQQTYILRMTDSFTGKIISITPKEYSSRKDLLEQRLMRDAQKDLMSNSEIAMLE